MRVAISGVVQLERWAIRAQMNWNERKTVERFDKLIVAAGGAYPELGSKGSLFPAIERLGTPWQPGVGSDFC